MDRTIQCEQERDRASKHNYSDQGQTVNIDILQNIAFADILTFCSFRRDQEDGGKAHVSFCKTFADNFNISEPPPRATFRSTLSQPSQMGNFKHQSIRTAERDRERDGEKDRDIRDKEGHERLRNVRLMPPTSDSYLTLLQLSDKYDRDRLALPANSTLRNRERDSAPHLSPGTTRVSSQTTLGTSNGRRTDTREVTKRKPGESSEDWRKGSSHNLSGSHLHTLK